MGREKYRNVHQQSRKTFLNESHLKKRAPEASYKHEQNEFKKSLLDNGIYIKDVEKLISSGYSHQDVKVYETIVPFMQDIILKDISLTKKHKQSDIGYASHFGVYENVRKGTTLVHFKNKHKTVIGRKDHKKIFELYPDYVAYNLKEISDFDGLAGCSGISSEDHVKMHRKIFFSLNKYFGEGKGTVSIVQTVKTDGIEGQVTWLSQLSTWLIASKDASGLFKTAEDIPFYGGGKYTNVELVAHEWFKTISTLNADQLEMLKSHLEDITILGELTGSKLHQQIVAYSKPQLRFFSMVNKNSTSHCENPRLTFELFSKFGLSTVQVAYSDNITNWNEFNENLRKIQAAVSSASTHDNEKGSVIYFVTKNNETGNEEVISLGELNTAEHGIIGHLKEKLRNLADKKQNIDVFKSFEEYLDSSKLRFKVDIKKDFYMQLLKLSAEFITKFEDSTYLIFTQFTDFITVMVYCCTTSLELTLSLFEDRVLDQLKAVSWDKLKSITAESLNLTPNFAIKAGRTIIFIPISIPGMGKTHFYQQVIKPHGENNKLMHRYVSSDKIRAAEMQNLKTKDPFAAEAVLFAKTKHLADEVFEKMVSHYVKERSHGDKIIFIDKSHSPVTAKSTVDLINKVKPKHSDVRLIAVIPKCKVGIHIKEGDNDPITFPLSEEIFLSCLLNIQIRKNHETFNGKGVDSASILINYFNRFRNIQFDRTFFKNMGFNCDLPIDFFSEGKLTFSTEAIEKLHQILTSMKKSSKKADFFKIDELLALIQSQLMSLNSNRASVQNQQKIISVLMSKLPLERPPAPVVPVIAPVKEIKKNEKSNGAAESKIIEKAKIYLKEFQVANQVALISYNENPPAKVNSKVRFAPKKIPDSLSVVFKNDEKQRILNIIRYGLLRMIENGGQSKVEEDLLLFESEELKEWEWASSNFKGEIVSTKRDPSKTNGEAYKQFEEGVNHPLKIKHLMYVPGKVIAALTFFDSSLLVVDEAFTHVNLAFKQGTDEFPLQVLASMFGGIFNQKYKEGLLFGADKVSSLSISLNDSAILTYLFELPEAQIFEAHTKSL